MQKISVNALEDKLLDAWVAKALGKQIMGTVLVQHDPEDGTPYISPEQEKVKDGFFSTHECYSYLKRCECEFFREMEEEEQERTIEMQKEYPDYTPPTEKKLFGHYHGCLSSVPPYSRDWSYAGSLMIKQRIGLIPLENNHWRATQGDRSIEALNPLYAIMRLIVSVAFGDTIRLEELIERG